MSKTKKIKKTTVVKDPRTGRTIYPRTPREVVRDIRIIRESGLGGVLC